MRTTLNIEDDLFPELMRLTRARTKTEAVSAALKEYVRQQRKLRLLASRGKMDIENNWRELRDMELREPENE
jgi:Arc/MetJ family transcription regulator